MKGFKRENQLFSLCGLNCGLCPMFLKGHCGGCGNGNQSCAIARCSLEHNKVQYCYQCDQYPCGRYEHLDDFDSFITHQRRKADLKKARCSGIEQYNQEQKEKMQILLWLLEKYNDGRRKTFYCVAVNLLEISELHEAQERIQSNAKLSELPFKQQCAYVVETLQKIAERRDVALKLNRKKKTSIQDKI